MKNILIGVIFLISINHSYAAKVNLYNKHIVSDWTVYVDSDLASVRPIEKEYLPKLKIGLDNIEKKLPKLFMSTVRDSGLKIFVTSYNNVGVRRGLFFIPKNNSDWSRNFERLMDNSIIIEYKSIFMKPSNFSYYLIHEFAHYYHNDILGYSNEYIWRKYHISKMDPNYKATYAMNNHLEFFAELSAMFFMMPKDLAKLDNDGVNLMKFLWSDKVLKSKILPVSSERNRMPNWNAIRKRNEEARKKLWSKK